MPPRDGDRSWQTRPGPAAWLVCLIVAAVARPCLADTNNPSPTTPAPGLVEVIGRQSAGCIAGAVRLPDTAPGLQTIRLSRSSYWGHPDTIAALLLLGRRAQAAGLPDVYGGDISDPRGGPLRGGHFSHQMGIDADIWLDVTPPHPVLALESRESIAPPSLVLPEERSVDPALWRPEHATLIRLAAELPGVDRVFVNPAIKERLCRDAGPDRAWLRLVRPWWGHAAHMHIRFRCPAGQARCEQDAPPPAGDGCGAGLSWWFDQLDAPPHPAGVPATDQMRPALPAACRAIMAR